jgi:excisionase family DNA binding protein
VRPYTSDALRTRTVYTRLPILAHVRLGEPEPALLTSTEAARLLGVSRRTVIRLARDGDLRAVRLGPNGNWRILRHGVAEIIRADPVTSPNGEVHGASPARIPPNQEAARWTHP